MSDAPYEGPTATVRVGRFLLTERRVDCSVYSIGDFDVASLAASFGGGGHRNAAGFSVTLEDWLAHFV